MAHFKDEIKMLLEQHENIYDNLDREHLIKQVINNKEVKVSSHGALSSVTPKDSTGRSPKDTYYVKQPGSAANIDWDSASNNAMAPETFERIFSDAISVLKSKKALYTTDRVLGADSKYALPVKTITDRALTALFTDNMFRQVPDDIEKSVFYGKEFHLIALPYDRLKADKYAGRLRSENGKTIDLAVVIDIDNRIGIVYGSAYLGSCKKLMFSAMDYYLPDVGVLPLHCSANEGSNGHVALLLGLSGTGKTSLSSDPDRALLGDDEHGWSNDGVFNLEAGCYAKLINLNPKKEPEIHHAITRNLHPHKHGAIVENAVMKQDGTFDFDDQSITENSRGSYPLSFLGNIKVPPVSKHPNTILFLAADANGVLPPVSRLSTDQAMLWFMMGYTSKLAGTETGIVEPTSTFSRFFGEPFMPRHPETYAKMLGEKLIEHGSQVFLVNTGWTGGPYGVGKRIDIGYTRKMVKAAFDGNLDNVKYRTNDLFHLEVPLECSGVPAEILDPKNTWSDKKAYDERAKKLAMQFAAHFDKVYGKKNIDAEIASQCPGK